MTGQEIIHSVLEHLKIKAPTLASSIGIGYQRIYDIQKGKTMKVSAAVANAIVSKYPEISRSWLLSGEGSMLQSLAPQARGDEAVYIKGESEEVYYESNHGIKYYEMGNSMYRMRVPLVPFNAYGRYLNTCDNSISQDRNDWDEVEFVVDRIGHGNYMAFEIKGDSMDDDSRRAFVQGDLVLVRELDRIHWKNLRYEKFPFWVIVFDSTILCKQITAVNEETGEITCHSLNPSPEYSDFTVHLDEVYRLFNIIQKTSRIMM